MSSLRTNQESDLIKQEVHRQVKNCPTFVIGKGKTSIAAKVALVHRMQRHREIFLLDFKMLKPQICRALQKTPFGSKTEIFCFRARGTEILIG